VFAASGGECDPKRFKKGQFSPWIEAVGGGTEVRFINRLFDLQA
jgi:transposase, IS6 family